MSGTSRPVLHDNVWTDIQGRLDRIEDKIDTRLTTLDHKVDSLGMRQTRLEGQLSGSIAMVRWLGPTGVAALLFALLKGAGFI